MSIILSKKQGCINSKYNIYYRCYQSANKRATIICIHGILSDSRLFDSFATVLAKNGLDVYAIDLPGYGLSDVKIDNTDFDNVIKSIHDLIRSMDDKPVLLGFSLGSVYAAGYASMYDDIAGLILVSSLLHPISSMLPEYAKVIYALYKKNPNERVNLLECIELDKNRYNRILNDPLCLKEYPLVYLIDIFLRATNPTILERIKMPTLLLHGKNDKFTDVKQVEETYNLLASKNKRLKVFDTDHWLFNTFFYDGSKDSKVISIIVEWVDNITKR